MSQRLTGLRHALRRASNIAAALLVVACAALGLAAYLAIRGPSLPLLHRGLGYLDRLVAGQRTERMAVDVRLVPATAHLTATATLTLKSVDAERQRFYFLLNPGLHIVRAQAKATDEVELRVFVYQLWALTVIDLGRPIQKDERLLLTLSYEGTPRLGLLGGANQLNPKEVLLNVDAFWYPVDAQSFFEADVRLTLPADLTVVYHGTNDSRSKYGDEQQVRWQSRRPIAGLALIAGHYTLSTRSRDGSDYRLYLAEDARLDGERVLEMMADADRILGQRFGSSGFGGTTMFVSRSFRRGFNDGSGVSGLSLRYFRAGDYGFALVAHEIAHNWWGGSVSGGWLSTGNGAQWIVEGLAECSSLLATEAVFGADALARRMPSELFDPARQAAVADMTVLDNALNEATARDTIYRKGAWVACMLRRVLGDEVFSRGLKEVAERFRYRHATDRDIQLVLEEVSGQKLEAYFADWLRSDRLLDLSIDPSGNNEVTVSNLGKAAVPGAVEVWTLKKDGGEPTRSTAQVGDKLRVDPQTEIILLDPQLHWADVQRENNRYPRREDPLFVSTSWQGSIAIAQGSPLPWGRVAVRSVDAHGVTAHTWELERGITQPPAWSPSGDALVVGNSVVELLPTILSLAADGTRRVVGRGNSPAPGPAGIVYAAQTDRLLRYAASGQSVVVQHSGMVIEQLMPSPDGTQLAYTVAKENHLDLRLIRSDGSDDRPLLSLDRDRLLLRWAPDNSRLYAVAGGSWDWQVWELPLDHEAPQSLANGAASVGDLGVSPDGSQLAFTAAATLEYPRNRRQLFVMNLGDRSVQRIDVPHADLSSLAWLDETSLLVVANGAPSDTPWTYPERRSLQRVDVPSRQVTPWP
jgi:hypothetical protein